MPKAHLFVLSSLLLVHPFSPLPWVNMREMVRWWGCRGFRSISILSKSIRIVCTHQIAIPKGFFLFLSSFKSGSIPY